MSRYLIDKSGEITAAYDEQLPEKFGYPMPDFDLPSYAVRNLGAVDVDVQGSSAIARFRWLTVSAVALETCMQLWRRLAVTDVTIHCETESWGEHRFENVEDAISWLRESQNLPANAHHRRASPHYVVLPQNLRTLADRPLNKLDQSEDHLAFFFKKWRLSQGRFSHDVTEALVRFGDIDRVVIASERSDGKLVFEHIGSRITVYDRADDAWTFRLNGRPIAEQPDRQYGQHVDSIFRSALERSQPTFDHIDAVVHDGRGALRFQYDRLLLPWKLESKQRILTSLSFKTNPDLPVEA